MSTRRPPRPAAPGRTLGALAVLLLATVAVPAALAIAAGWPLPRELPTMDGLVALLRGGAVSDGFLVDLVAVAAWLAWAQFLACVVVELVALARGRAPGRVPLSGPAQALAARLVGALMLVTVATPRLATAAAADPLAAGPAVPPAHVVAAVTAPPAGGGRPTATTVIRVPVLPAVGSAASTPTIATPGAPKPDPPPREHEQRPRAKRDDTPSQALWYTVRRRDTLWGVAERHLGDGMRWKDIHRLNHHRAQPDGRRLVDPDWIYPGWRLRLPPDARDGRPEQPRPPREARHRPDAPGAGAEAPKPPAKHQPLTTQPPPAKQAPPAKQSPAPARAPAPAPAPARTPSPTSVPAPASGEPGAPTAPTTPDTTAQGAARDAVRDVARDGRTAAETGDRGDGRLYATIAGAALVGMGGLVALARRVRARRGPAAWVDDLAEEAAGEPEVEVRVLGPVGVKGVATMERAKSLELIAFLALHPGGADAAQVWAALWPDTPLNQETLHTIVSTARNRIGEAPDGSPYFPRSADGLYRLHPDIALDWARFQALTARDEDRSDYLRRALGLVRGEPLQPPAPNAYAWAAGLRREIAAEIVDTAEELAGHCFEAGDPVAAAWAARRGLVADPAEERLYRVLMLAAHESGDPEGVDAVLDDLRAGLPDGADLFDRLRPETVELYEQLRPGGRERGAR